jgi:hypothetical protein
MFFQDVGINRITSPKRCFIQWYPVFSNAAIDDAAYPAIAYGESFLEK